MTNGKFTINAEQRRELLDSHNDLKTALQTISECHDLFMSDISNIEKMVSRMERHLNFALPTNGHKYMDCVLAEDKKPAPNKVTRRNKSKEAAQ